MVLFTLLRQPFTRVSAESISIKTINIHNAQITITIFRILGSPAPQHRALEMNHRGLMIHLNIFGIAFNYRKGVVRVPMARKQSAFESSRSVQKIEKNLLKRCRPWVSVDVSGWDGGWQVGSLEPKLHHLVTPSDLF